MRHPPGLGDPSGGAAVGGPALSDSPSTCPAAPTGQTLASLTTVPSGRRSGGRSGTLGVAMPSEDSIREGGAAVGRAAGSGSGARIQSEDGAGLLPGRLEGMQAGCRRA
jgi:hypothetical protein